jgi:hypothetical protein
VHYVLCIFNTQNFCINGIGNAFFVCIGTKKAYNLTLRLSVTKRLNKLKSLYLHKSPNYKTWFVDFKGNVSQLWNGYIRKTYKGDDVVLMYVSHAFL